MATVVLRTNDLLNFGRALVMIEFWAEKRVCGDKAVPAVTELGTSPEHRVLRHLYTALPAVGSYSRGGKRAKLGYVAGESRSVRLIEVEVEDPLAFLQDLDQAVTWAFEHLTRGGTVAVANLGKSGRIKHDWVSHLQACVRATMQAYA